MSSPKSKIHKPRKKNVHLRLGDVSGELCRGRTMERPGRGQRRRGRGVGGATCWLLDGDLRRFGVRRSGSDAGSIGRQSSGVRWPAQCAGTAGMMGGDRRRAPRQGDCRSIGDRLYLDWPRSRTGLARVPGLALALGTRGRHALTRVPAVSTALALIDYPLDSHATDGSTLRYFWYSLSPRYTFANAFVLTSLSVLSYFAACFHPPIRAACPLLRCAASRLLVSILCALNASLFVSPCAR